MSSDIAISIQNVGKCYEMYAEPHHRLFQTLTMGRKNFYKEFWALRDISFEVKKGECIGIIGRNGCGKSTLLQIIAGTLRPTTGSVTVNGRIAALLELGSGFNPEFTGRENVYMNGTVLGLSHKEIDEKFDDIAAFADIGEFIEQPVKIYSSGMMVRLAFAVNVHIDANILIIDEALAVGDIAFQAKCFKKLKSIQEQGVSIIFVTHDLSSIVNFCKKAILLENSQIFASGYPNDVIEIFRKLLSYNDKGSSSIVKSFDCGNRECDFHSQEELKRNFLLNPNVKEYGNRKAQIIDWAIINESNIPTNILNSGETFVILIKIRFNKDLAAPCVGFFLKDIKGLEITGTNTEYMGQPLFDMKAGSTLTLRFTQKISFAPGYYLLNLGCSETLPTGELVAYHRIYDLLIISVLMTQRFVGLINPESTFTVTRQ